MVHLSQSHYISQGSMRACYQHPDNAHLCIKIPLTNKRSSLKRRHLNSILKEKKYLNKLEKKIGHKNPAVYAKYLGDIQTNLGTGSVHQLIRNETDMHISKTLYEYQKQTKTDNDICIRDIKNSLQDLKNKMIDHHILWRDITPHNICLQVLKDGSKRLIIIDGLGCKDALPFLYIFKGYTRYRIEKRLSRLWPINKKHLN